MPYETLRYRMQKSNVDVYRLSPKASPCTSKPMHSSGATVPLA